MLALDMLRGAADAGAQPTLDLNFTSGTLDSRVTYTGASLATLTDATGKIAYKPHNLLTWSAVSTTNWSLATNVTVTAGTVADPEGALTGATVSWGAASAGNGVLKVISGVNGAANTKAIYVRADVAGGTVELVDPGTTAGATVATLTTAWQRVSLSEVAGAQLASGGVWLRKTASSPATVYACWASFNLGALQPYYPTTGSAYYGPRFTYDPVTHAALGLLVEEQRTNLITYSEQVDNAAWVKTGCTITAGAIAAPDGNTTADLVVATGAPGSAYVQTSAPASTSGTATFSVYAKAGTRSTFNMTTFNGSPNTDFDLSTASKTDKNGAVGSITHVGGGWYRCVSTVTLGAPSTQRSFLWSIDGIYIWGAQLEAGAFATSYIPTTSASVTRAADSATMTGSNFSSWFNATQGTFVADATYVPGASGAAAMVVFSANNASANGYMTYKGSLSGSITPIYDAGTLASVLAALPGDNRVKYAMTYSATSDTACANGGAISSAATISVATPIQMQIGRAVAGYLFTGTIARLRYYNTALTSAQLQALTT